MNDVNSLHPKGYAIRKAVQWLSSLDIITINAIEEASMKFNLSPREEEFLIKKFITNRES